ncbi:hypothetical protein BY996DRAFT_6428093 [Phakopsora pachyrhizi]|nr:hypothetical protein BY996DRAFT_6428093 [Phakopsora pachyrhizi]
MSYTDDPSITITQAAEIEAPSDSVSKTIKHQLSHQSIQNTLPPTKRHSKRLQALPKTQAGRVLQGFQSSYSLRNPTGQGLIPQGGIPISAKDWTSTNGEQIQENEKSTDNVLSGAVTSIELMEKPSFTAEEVSQALDNCMFIIRESLKICGIKKTENEELEMVYKALPSFIVDRCQSDLDNVVEEVCELMRVVDDNFSPSTVFKNIDPKSSSGFIVVYEELLTVFLQSSSLKTHYGPVGGSVIGGAGIKKVTNSKYPKLEHKLTKNATESKVKFEQQCLYFLSIFFLLGPRAIFTANSQDHQKAGKVALIGKTGSHKDDN